MNGHRTEKRDERGKGKTGRARTRMVAVAQYWLTLCFAPDEDGADDPNDKNQNTTQGSRSSF